MPGHNLYVKDRQNLITSNRKKCGKFYGTDGECRRNNPDSQEDITICSGNPFQPMYPPSLADSP